MANHLHKHNNKKGETYDTLQIYTYIINIYFHYTALEVQLYFTLSNYCIQKNINADVCKCLAGSKLLTQFYILKE